MGHSEDSPEREVHSDMSLSKKDRNISKKQPHLHRQEIEEQR